MSQTGYTPILVYGSTTASNVPLAANLTTNSSGVELAINAADGKLFYKDSSGVVQVLATKAGAFGTVTSVAATVPSFLSISGSPITSSGTLAIGLSGTALPTTSGGTGLTSFTANGVVYASSTSALTTGSALTFTGSALGVNVATPLSALHVVEGGGVLRTFDNTDGIILTSYSASKSIGFSTSSAGNYGSDGGSNTFLKLTPGASGTMIFGASGSEQMRLTSSLLSVVPGATIQGLTVGRGAGAVSTNTAVGASALAANTTGDQNTSVGQNSLSANTTGAGNSSFGRNSLVNSTTGSANTAIGLSALQANTTASNNTAVGYQAAYSNTTGSGILAIGYQAGYSNTTGNGNTAIGNGNAYTGAALYSNISGGNNVAVGSGSLYTNTASNNTAVGYEAGKLTSSGGSNVALGTQSLFSNTTASNNTAVGYQAGYANTTGTRNTFVGTSAGAGFTTGSYNAAFGSFAMQATTSTNNTAIGDYALQQLTTGGYNTALGNGSGYLITTGSKNTIVGLYNGNQGGLDIRTASNYIVLSDGDGNPRGVFDSSGNFLVGTTTYNDTVTGILGSASGKLYATASAVDVLSLNRLVSDGAIVSFKRSNTTVGSVSVTTTATAYNTSSDYRLKKDIAPMTGALATVAALKPVTYKWKFDGSDGQGFIAHELAEVVPDCVTGEKDAVDADGNPIYQGIDVSFLVGTLTAAIQELKAEFDAYKATHP